ncbi:MAG: hypothetical protein WCI97_04530 [Bacteroidota bacterium]
MYERAKYFSTKFIRNGIAGIGISTLLIYADFEKSNSITPTHIFFVVVSLFWLYAGYSLNKNLKRKTEAIDSNEIPETGITYKQVEYFFSIAIIAFLLLSTYHYQYINYIAVPLLAGYIGWLFIQMKTLNSYFKK